MTRREPLQGSKRKLYKYYVNKTIRKYWYMIEQDPELKEIAEREPIITYRQNKTIQDYINKKNNIKRGYLHEIRKLITCKSTCISGLKQSNSNRTRLSKVAIHLSTFLRELSGRIIIKMFLGFFTFFSMAVFVQGETKCYENLGCFSNDYPYKSVTRPVSIFPQSPESINTQFFLFTQQNTDQYQVVSAKNLSSIEQSNFDGSRNSVFIVHGYSDSGSEPWPMEMSQTIVRRENVNCFNVDWSGGSSANYFQAMNNVQVVGAEIANFINTLMKHFNSSLSGIHMIGHSLGVHAVGEAGKRRPGIGKITCLDAARPGFEGESNEVTIDPSDADFVVAIHTDAGVIGLGMTTLIGDIDLFPNGGKQMTGCAGSQIMDLGESEDFGDGNYTKYDLLIVSLRGQSYDHHIQDTVFRDVALCSHVAAYRIFTSSIRNPEGFMGYCASTYSSFQEGAGFPCSGGSCSVMGYYTKPPGDTSSCRTYYLNTGPRHNYERWRYNVAVQTRGTYNFIGSITITMYNSSDSSDEHKIHSGSIKGGMSYSAFIDGRFPPPIARVTFSYPKILTVLSPNLWAESVTVTLGNDGAEYTFCSDETTKENNPQTLTPCP
ncbi:pancreatic lipase-related protein 2-like [Hyla sarda]|uniref:pancreatic lipase-related protein 2-like n=1 Tax=Hyla sarda TaxID=327740 RepID=UPI0024C2F2EA|nr:pancreatic lipase-related protein 2-like [Hyla sarda]